MLGARTRPVVPAVGLLGRVRAGRGRADLPRTLRCRAKRSWTWSPRWSTSRCSSGSATARAPATGCSKWSASTARPGWARPRNSPRWPAALRVVRRGGALRRRALGQPGPGGPDAAACGTSRPTCGSRWSTRSPKGRPRWPCASRPTCRTTGSSAVSCPRAGTGWTGPSPCPRRGTGPGSRAACGLLDRLRAGRPPRADALLAEAKDLAATLPPSPENAFIPVVEGNIAMFAGDQTRRSRSSRKRFPFPRMGVRAGELWCLSVLGLARGLSATPAGRLRGPAGLPGSGGESRARCGGARSRSGR